MKKIAITMVLIIFGMLNLTACGSKNDEVAELRQRVETLEAKVQELESSKVVGTQTKELGDKETTTATKGTENADTTEEQQLVEYFDVLLNSSDPDNWLKVAKDNTATEEQLKIVAIQCADISCYKTYDEDEKKQLEIADALSKNPKTTTTVMVELINSKYTTVVEKATEFIEKNQ